MYPMEERDSIIHAYRREGLSIREIARRNGMSRKTVRKYLRAFEQSVGDTPDAEAMDTYLQQPVRYDSGKRVRRVMNQQVMEATDGFMARNRSNAAVGLRKQQMRKIDMWRRLRDQGIGIAYSTVCQYVRALEVAVSAPAKSPAAFIRQEYGPGVRCEFDWGVLTLWIDGRDKVATHVRSRRPGDRRIDLMHYLGTFLRKPAALGRSTAMQQVHPDVAALFRKHFADSPGSFVELLVFTRDNRRTCADILAAADRLSSRGLKRQSSEQLSAEMLTCDGNEAANVHQDAATLSPSDPQQTAIEESASQTLDTLPAMIGCGSTQQSVNKITV